MDPTAPNNNNPFDHSSPTTPSSSPPPPPSGISATIIDPNDPLVNQPNSGASGPVDNQIQPGQYVVAGQDSTVTQPAPLEPQSAPFATPPPAPAVSPLAGAEPIPAPMPTPMPAPNLAQPIVQPQAPAAFAQAAPLSGATAGAAGQQPDPTPYAPPPPGPTQQSNDSGSSMIKKLRLVAIGLGVIVLLGAIGALLWFFLLSKNNSSPAKVETTENAPVAEPSPPPKRTGSGFDTLPALKQSTSSALETTPSAR